ncbi:MAG: UDP-N-acetylglucosamine 1-carboxyvinyltransferase [Chlamydiae bacterium SM23_39]|nr:MAG: UDP-N-acetylglucosamine 1-carboxyvinyltransferase [Chlamydiae bacterium SM23_39]
MKTSSIKINGKTPLKGKIKASGAKNSITKLLVASLLSDKKSIFYNVPNILEVDITLQLCKEIGMEYLWDKDKKVIEVKTKHIKTSSISQRFSGANRIPILILGALISRVKNKITVPIVGGDKLGKRPVDFHINSLKLLGADIEYNEYAKTYSAQAKNGLIGTLIKLPYPSVGATENSILAAVKAKGTTIIKNAAIEPEIIDFIRFLKKIGVQIVIRNRTIYIEETKNFFEAEHSVLSDRNEVASYALAAICTKGRIFIEKAEHIQMKAFLNALKKTKGGYEIKKNGIEFFYTGQLEGNILLETDVHPGFMTDWQPLFGALLTQCKGSSIIHETVYEKRFEYIKMLKEMGANIELSTKCLGKNCRFDKKNHYHSAIIKGSTPLLGKNISIPDLRAGFAYIMAALIAEGESNISQLHFLERGYENIIQKLSSLGARIQKNTDLIKKTYTYSNIK